MWLGLQRQMGVRIDFEGVTVEDFMGKVMFALGPEGWVEIC